MTEFIALGLLMIAALAVAGTSLAVWMSRRLGLGRWCLTYLRKRSTYRTPRRDETVHLLLCIADHFEPGNGNVSQAVARRRLNNWTQDYPRLCDEFRDSDGLPPRHTFFYPIEMYNEVELEGLAELCRSGLGEVEIHLHHDGDTSENLRKTLLRFTELFAGRHGLLARNRDTGALAYGFVHGNWALDNSSPDGRCCGVNDEIGILRATGCYADFTMPSAPSPTQTRKINSVYYAVDNPREAKSHDTGSDVGTGVVPADGLMMIQGPLLPNWRRRKWGIFPRIENGCLQGNQPPSTERLDDWLRARIQVPTRPDWYFVKLHTHGAPEGNQRMLLGEPMFAFHRALAARANENPEFQFHYVTAREMYNLARAAEAGWQGTVAAARDYELVGAVPRLSGSTGPADRLDDLHSREGPPGT